MINTLTKEDFDYLKFRMELFNEAAQGLIGKTIPIDSSLLGLFHYEHSGEILCEVVKVNAHAGMFEAEFDCPIEKCKRTETVLIKELLNT